jgi:hypothetical protein
MKIGSQMAVYIFIARSKLDVCSVNLISRRSPSKMPQAMSSEGPDRCSHPRITRPHDHSDSQKRVLASTLFAVRTLEIP